ncbi:MAG: mechanosensitive ion channel domain-containing protein [Pirellulaceae bacterium]
MVRRIRSVVAVFLVGMSIALSARAQYQPLELFQPPPATAPAPATGEALSLPPATADDPAKSSAAETAAAPATQFVGLESLTSEIGQSWEGVWRSVRQVWNIVLVQGADKTPLVTIGTLSGGLVLLGFGYIAAGVISRGLASRLLVRFGMNKSAIAPLQSITFYVLLATFTMLSLNVLNVPMTVFSFLGGALAIGAGFGSQNIVNNFISGLILLAERPIRVGDVIQLDSWTGMVSHIGARSTKISTAANHEIIVPNSKLLETSVVNWTLSDDTVGGTIAVGVAYGSPTREVERLLLLAANEHSEVLKDPAPELLFKDFGADALQFEIRFWVHLRACKKGEVESDLRFRIDELLADRGIVMAYPQRDVHLNLLRPVEVRLTQPLGSQKSAA